MQKNDLKQLIHDQNAEHENAILQGRKMLLDEIKNLDLREYTVNNLATGFTAEQLSRIEEVLLDVSYLLCGLNQRPIMVDGEICSRYVGPNKLLGAIMRHDWEQVLNYGNEVDHMAIAVYMKFMINIVPAILIPKPF